MYKRVCDGSNSQPAYIRQSSGVLVALHTRKYSLLLAIWEGLELYNNISMGKNPIP